MTDLTGTLYEFVMQNRMGGVWDDPEYSDFCRCAQAREQALRQRLDPEGAQLLDDLLGELSRRHWVEQEVLFHRTLSLSGELLDLLR